MRLLSFAIALAVSNVCVVSFALGETTDETLGSAPSTVEANVASTSPVKDAPQSGEEKDPASAAFEQGKSLYNEFRFKEASSAFREAYRLRPTWKLLYNLGQSEAAAKRLGPALEAFEAYLAQGGDEIESARAEAVRTEILRLRDLVGFIDVKAPEGMQLVVDDLVRGETPLPGVIPISAGIPHSVSLSKNGEIFRETTVKVVGGQTSVLDLRPTPPSPLPVAVIPESSATPPVPAIQAKDTASAGHLNGIAWTVTGLGAALLLGAVGTGATALVLDNDIENDCPDGVCDSTSADTLTTRDRLAVTTNVLLGVGGAALTAGIITLVALKSKGRDKNVSAAVDISPRSAGVGLEWKF